MNVPDTSNKTTDPTAVPAAHDPLVNVTIPTYPVAPLVTPVHIPPTSGATVTPESKFISQ